MSLGTPIGAAIYSGNGISTLVPRPYPVAIAGHAYPVDYAHDINGFRGQFFHHKSIPALRPSQDTSASFGEQSLNPEGLPRWSADSWHHGAGQSYLEHSDSDEFRFRSSKGVDPWTVGQLSLHHDTANRLAGVSTNYLLAVAGGYLYSADGTALKFTQDVTVGSPTWTTVTGTPAAAATSISSDGYNVYTAHAANGIYATTRGGASTAQLVTTALDSTAIVAAVKGRLMVGWKNGVYNVTSTTPAALPTVLFTHNNTDFTWVGFAEGPGYIYAAGYSGDKSQVYKVTIKSDGTALDVATFVVAAELPSGEIVRSIRGYLGFVLIGTDKGVRVASPDANGFLTLGALIQTGAAVQCFTPQDRYVWYGLSNYDATSTGLGRVDLRTVGATGLEPLTPAYATDLMATAQGAVQSVVTFQNIRVFGVSGVGVFAETTTKVPSGTLQNGYVTYGIVDPKVAVYLDVRHQPLAGTVKGSLAVDGAAFVQLGSATVAGGISETFNASQARGYLLETQVELDRSTLDTTTGPVLTKVTLRANPVPATGTEIVIPVILTTRELLEGADGTRDPDAEYAYLESLRTSGQIVVYQEKLQTYTVTITDLTWLPVEPTALTDTYESTLVVTLKTLV